MAEVLVRLEILVLLFLRGGRAYVLNCFPLLHHQKQDPLLSICLRGCLGIPDVLLRVLERQLAGTTPRPQLITFLFIFMEIEVFQNTK